MGQGQEDACERELEACEVDAEEGSLLGGADEGGDSEAQGGEGGVDEDEKDHLGAEFPGEMGEGVDEEAHPDRLGNDKEAEEDCLAGEVGAGTEAGDLFLFEDQALGRDLPPRR